MARVVQIVIQDGGRFVGRGSGVAFWMMKMKENEWDCIWQRRILEFAV